MSDNAKLKELAEALKRAIEQAEHKPGEWAGTAQSMGGICCPGVPFQIGKPWAKEEPWASFSYKRDSWLAVAAVNALPRLLGLIAEIERLQGCEDVLRQLASHVGAGGYNAPEVDPETFARKIMDGINILNDPMAQLVIKKGEQIDQLRAEVAGLRTGYEAYERVNAELKAEVEALRKERDARHPFKPFHEPSIGFTGCVICGVYTDHGGLPCPRTRATADAAMGQGEQS